MGYYNFETSKYVSYDRAKPVGMVDGEMIYLPRMIRLDESLRRGFERKLEEYKGRRSRYMHGDKIERAGLVHEYKIVLIEQLLQKDCVRPGPVLKKFFGKDAKKRAVQTMVYVSAVQDGFGFLGREDEDTHFAAFVAVTAYVIGEYASRQRSL